MQPWDLNPGPTGPKSEVQPLELPTVASKWFHVFRPDNVTSTFATLTPIPSTGCRKPKMSPVPVQVPTIPKSLTVVPILIQIPDESNNSGKPGTGLKVADISKLTSKPDQPESGNSTSLTVIDASSKHRTIIFQVPNQLTITSL